MNVAADYKKEKQEYQKWLNSLKVGDVVVIEHWYFGTTYSIEKIQKITATRRIVVGNYTFRSDGKVFGSNYSSVRLREYTPEITEKIKQQNIQRNVKNKLIEFSEKGFRLTDEQYIALDNFFKEQGFYDD